MSLLAIETSAVDDCFADRLTLSNDIDGTTAFMLNPEVAKTPLLADEIIDYAKSFLGKPYRSGGKGPSAFDCSGFTSYIFRNFDIKLNASSSAQYTQGIGIEDSDVKPGDLLFFKGRNASPMRVGHVGMVVEVTEDGSFTFIHASNTGGIRYDTYPDGGYYSKRYVGARRVLDQ